MKTPPLGGPGGPGSARRVRTAYSRTLCLPCLKAGFFCFLHYRCWPLYVQLFILNFLCICLLLFGTSFFSFHPFITFLRWLFTAAAQTSTEALLVSNRACLGLCWCRFPTPSPDRPKIAAQGRVWVFSPKTNSPLPLKGEGRSVAFLWFVGVFTQRNPVLFRRKDGYFVSEGFSRQLPVATAGHNWLTRLQQGLFGAALVSLPYLAFIIAHRAAQGRVWFRLAGWRF